MERTSGRGFEPATRLMNDSIRLTNASSRRREDSGFRKSCADLKFI